MVKWSAERFPVPGTGYRSIQNNRTGNITRVIGHIDRGGQRRKVTTGVPAVWFR